MGVCVFHRPAKMGGLHYTADCPGSDGQIEIEELELRVFEGFHMCWSFLLLFLKPT